MTMCHRLLLDENYRKNTRCAYYRNLLQQKSYPIFPADVVRAAGGRKCNLDGFIESQRPLIVISDDVTVDLGLVVPRKEVCDVHLMYITGLIG